MKILVFFLIISLAISGIIFNISGIQACTAYENCDKTNDVEIQNIQVHPYAVKVGDAFTVNATLVNNLPNPIYVEHGACSAIFSMSFDNHVIINNKIEACTTNMIIHKLNQGEKITGTSPPPLDITYRAMTVGTANATVTFSYEMWDQDAQSNISKTVSKPFSFKIYGISSEILSPYKQFASGVKAENVVCKPGLELVMKKSNGYPLCVKGTSIKKLTERKFIPEYNGWNSQIQLDKLNQFDSNFADKVARISIEGLKEEYRQGESIKFTIQAHEFSIGCESVRVMVFNEYKTQPPLYEKEFVAECEPNSKPTQTDYSFPILINNLNNDKSGKYVVVASYYQNRGSFGDVEQNFTISS